MTARTRSAAIALPAVLVVAIILVIAGLAGSYHVSAARRTFERLYAERLLMLAADSSFEEVSGRLESMNQNLPFPGYADLNPPRNLKTKLSIPPEIEPDLSRDSVKDQGVTMTPVALSSSDWVLQSDPHYQQRYVVVREVGILDLSIEVTVRAGSSTLRGRVSCRRYMDASVDGTEKVLKLHVLPRNMVLRIDRS